MNPIQTNHIQKDKVVDVRQVEIEKKEVFLGRMIPKRGHTIFEINLLNHTIKAAEFEESDILKPSFEKSKSRGYGMEERADGTKKLHLDKLPPVTKKLIKKKYCIYISALNLKSVHRKLEKMGLIKIKKS